MDLVVLLVSNLVAAANGTGDPYPGDNTASSPSNGWGNNAGGGHLLTLLVQVVVVLAVLELMVLQDPNITGKGGDGIQLRPEFHNSSHPDTIGAAGFAAGTPGNFFLAGGGGGGSYTTAPHPASQQGAGGGGNPTPETNGAGGGYGGAGSDPYAGGDPGTRWHRRWWRWWWTHFSH